MELGRSEHIYLARLATSIYCNHMISITGRLKFWRCPTNDTQACFAWFRFGLAFTPHSKYWSMRQKFAMLYFVDRHAGKHDAEGAVNSSHFHSPRTYAQCDLSYVSVILNHSIPIMSITTAEIDDPKKFTIRFISTGCPKGRGPSESLETKYK